MLTNIVAAIVLTLSTNVSETDNGQYRDYGTGAFYANYPSSGEVKDHVCIKAPTERVITTVITETRTLEGEAEGKKFTELLSTREVKRTEQRLKLEQRWVEGPVQEVKAPVWISTNSTLLWSSGTVTNVIFVPGIFTTNRYFGAEKEIQSTP